MRLCFIHKLIINDNNWSERELVVHVRARLGWRTKVLWTIRACAAIERCWIWMDGEKQPKLKAWLTSLTIMTPFVVQMWMHATLDLNMILYVARANHSHTHIHIKKQPCGLCRVNASASSRKKCINTVKAKCVHVCFANFSEKGIEWKKRPRRAVTVPHVSVYWKAYNPDISSHTWSSKAHNSIIMSLQVFIQSTFNSANIRRKARRSQKERPVNKKRKFAAITGDWTEQIKSRHISHV